MGKGLLLQQLTESDLGRQQQRKKQHINFINDTSVAAETAKTKVTSVFQKHYTHGGRDTYVLQQSSKTEVQLRMRGPVLHTQGSFVHRQLSESVSVGVQG